MTASPSLAARAAAAVSLMIGFYLLALGMAALLLGIPLAEYHWANRLDLRIAVFCVLGAVAILRAIVPRRDLDRGWALSALPGEPVLLTKGEARLAPLESIVKIGAGSLGAEEWNASGRAVGLLDVDLAASHGQAPRASLTPSPR